MSRVLSMLIEVGCMVVNILIFFCFLFEGYGVIWWFIEDYLMVLVVFLLIF